MKRWQSERGNCSSPRIDHPSRALRLFGRASTLLMAVLLGGISCESGAPTFDTGEGTGKTDVEGGDDPRIDFELIAPPSNQKAIELINTDESSSTIQVSLTLTNDPEGKTRDDYKVVWCNEFDLGEGPVKLPLCNDESCNALWGDDLTHGTAKLTVFGSDFDLGDELVTKHKVRAILVNADLFKASNEQCPDTPQEGFKERLSIDVNVRRLVGGPNTKIVEAPGGGCHTAKFALRAEIKALPNFENATYEIRWYNGKPDTGVRIQTLDVVAKDGAVCSGLDTLTTGNAACFLKTSQFKKDQTISVTARVVSDGGGDVQGTETTDPASVQICDAWPECSSGVKLVVDPQGAAGTLKCQATCKDPDGDAVYAQAVFINDSDPLREAEVVTLTQPVPIGGNGEANVEVTFDLESADPTFARKGNDVHCELYPYGGNQTDWHNDPSYPFTNDPDEAKPDDPATAKTLAVSTKVKISNTPPEIASVRILPEVPPFDVARTYRCDILGEVFDVDDADTELYVTYRWLNGSLGDTPVGAPRTGLYYPNSPIQTDIDDSKVVPVQEGGITKGQDLCCEVEVADSTDKSAIKAVERACLRLENGVPNILPSGGDPGKKLKIGIVEKLGSTEAPECTPDDAPSTPGGSTNVFYTWQTLVCEHNGALFDPDPTDQIAGYFQYRWYNCNNGSFGNQLYEDNSPEAPPNALPKDTYICCAAVACDNTGCNEAGLLKMAASDAVQIINSPPKAVPPTVVTQNPAEDGDKQDFFQCNAAPLDCDADDVENLTVSYEWLKVSQSGTQTPIGVLGQKVQKFGLNELSCSDSLVCRYQVSDGTPAVTSPNSAPFALSNSAPKLTNLQATAIGTVTPTSTVSCKWSGVSDANQDAVTKVEVSWHRVMSKDPVTGEITSAPLFPLPQILNPPNVLAPAGQSNLVLGTCGGNTLVSPGDEIFCEVKLCDGCGCSEPVSSYPPPFGSSLVVQPNPTPVTLKPGADLPSLSTTSIDKGVPFTCSLNTDALQFCDNNDLNNLTFIYQLMGPNNTVLINPEGDDIGLFQTTMTLNSCTAASKAWCKITVLNPNGQPLLSDTGAIVDIDENPPAVQADILPAFAVVGDTVTCNVQVQDADSEDNPTVLIKWFKGKDGVGLIEQPELQGQTSVTLSAGSFASGDVVRCTAEADDGCFPPVVDQSPTIVLGNSPPTVAKPVIEPNFPKTGETLACNVDIGTYSDPDSSGASSFSTFQFVWESSATSNGPWTTVNPTPTCQQNFPNGGVSNLTMPNCMPALTKGTYVRCSVTPIDQTMAASGQPGIAAISTPVQLSDSLPHFVGAITVVPATGQLGSAPTLDSNQSNVVCQAQAVDEDAGEEPTLSYVWSLLSPAGTPIQTLLASPSNTLNVAALFPQAHACDVVRCRVDLKSGPTLIESQSATLPIRNGGSLRFTGSPARIDITTVPAPGTGPSDTSPSSGILELWFQPETLPSAGQRQVLVYGNSEGADPEWELAIAASGVVQLRRQGTVATLPGGSSWPSIVVGAWNHIAVQWTPGQSTVSAFTASGGSAAVAVSGSITFEMNDLSIGSTSMPPRGWMDELRVRNTPAPPATNDPYFLVGAPGSMAVYHFDLHNTVVPVDSGVFQFHGTFASASEAPLPSYHAQFDTCGTDACSADGPCVLKPTSVVQEFAGLPISPGGAPSTYQVRCTASGAVDLEAGPVSQYQFTWKNVTSGATINPVPQIGNGNSTRGITVSSGCIDVICEAAPVPVGGGAAGPPGVSSSVRLCRATTQIIQDFACEDENPCSQDSTDMTLGCQHQFDSGAACSLPGGCAQGLEPSCAGTAGFPCVCDDPCPDNPSQPCTESVWNGSTCVNQYKGDGAVCVPFSQCAAPGANNNGTCSASGCGGFAPKVCDDGNECTFDLCNDATGCSFPPVQNGTGCEDGNSCTHPDQCLAGVCQPGGAVNCDDGEVCTTESCNPNSPVPGPPTGPGSPGACVFNNNDGASCTDGNPCTTVDACAGGQCVGTGANSCDDGNPCTTDSCPGGAGCVNIPNSLPCSDGSACTVGDICSGGACQPGPAANCDDGNPCTADSCDLADGCKYPAQSGACSDGNACTGNDQCAAGTCSGTPLDCNDGNDCTSDGCNPATGCVNNNTTTTCNDGNACTNNDKCSGGTCQGTSIGNCDDGNPCTDDSCNPAVGCQNINNTSACDDGNACTANDSCANGQCVSGTTIDCNSGSNNPCLVSLCDPGSGCQSPTQTTSPCDDGNQCTTGDKCSSGSCSGTGTLNCDDGNVCTANTCVPSTGCKQTAIQGTNCDDGNPCTTGDVCTVEFGSGVCKGIGLDCNDNNVCTNDACDPLTGCSYTNNTKPCNDGNVCTTGDICGGGLCSGPTPLICNDGNPCTSDGCNPVSGCFFTNNDNNTCSDADECTTVDECSAGVCVGSVPPICDDGNDCTANSCDPATGCVHTNTTDACEDGTVCTTNDVCSGGLCLSGPALNCSDGNPCTTDFCHPTLGCQHTPNSEVCDDGDLCTDGDQCAGGTCVPGSAVDCDDGNLCTDDVCVPAAGCTTTFNTAPCSDGSACTVGDACGGGSCVPGAGAVCDDGNECTDDPCDASAGCNSTPNNNPCEDGNFCTLGDQCASGICVAGAPKVCNDGKQCTIDTCNSTTGACVYTNTTGPCSDGDACTTGDTCVADTCTPAGVTNCDDGIFCTSDDCNSQTGCVSTPSPGKPCSDGNPCTSGDTCQGGACQPGSTPTDCDDNNECTNDSCSTTLGCVTEPVADNQPCEDGDLCTINDSCQQGVCTGETTYCCADFANWPGGCGYTSAVSLSPTASQTYSGVPCGTTNPTGGQAIECVPSAQNSNMEICLDVAGNGTGSYLLFHDDSASVQFDECVQGLEDGACTAVAQLPQDVLFWQLVLHADAAEPSARYHVRCPETASCVAAGASLQCDDAITCPAASDGGGAWSGTIADYGATCGSGFGGTHRAFRFTAPSAGNYTVWLSSTAPVEDMQVLVVPVSSGTATCNAGISSQCTSTGPSPFVFNSTSANQHYCIFVEQIQSNGNPNLNISVSCH